MRQHRRAVKTLPLLGILWSVAGCSGVDRMDRKIDMAAEHIASDKPVYEGRLTSSQVVGPMVSLQFADGQIYEVAQTPATFVPGDIVRIYKTDKGYEAHLWKASKDQVLPTGSGLAPK